MPPEPRPACRAASLGWDLASGVGDREGARVASNPVASSSAKSKLGLPACGMWLCCASEGNSCGVCGLWA